jgi:Uma2 family endonuclease
VEGDRMAGTEARRYTYADLQQFPEGEGTRYEIIDGELFVTPSPNRAHQRLVLRLATALNSFVEAHTAGEVYVAPFDVLFNELNVVIPDVLFVSAARLDAIERNGVHGAPDLVIEVLSPGTRRVDLTRKKVLYEQRGAEEYWLVDPEARTLTIMRRAQGGFAEPDVYAAGGGRQVSTALLPEFAIDLDALFRGV